MNGVRPEHDGPQVVANVELRALLRKLDRLQSMVARGSLVAASNELGEWADSIAARLTSPTERTNNA